MKLLFRKSLGSLRPVDDAGELALQKVKNGDLVMVELKRPRNLQFHRLYWALLTTVWQNLDEKRAAHYPKPDSLHDAIKLAVGLKTPIVMPTGEVFFKPGSIAFHSMSAEDFESFYQKVADLLTTHWLPGVTSLELRQEVESMIGERT